MPPYNALGGAFAGLSQGLNTILALRQAEADRKRQEERDRMADLVAKAGLAAQGVRFGERPDAPELSVPDVTGVGVSAPVPLTMNDTVRESMRDAFFPAISDEAYLNVGQSPAGQSRAFQALRDAASQRQRREDVARAERIRAEDLARRAAERAEDQRREDAAREDQQAFQRGLLQDRAAAASAPKPADSHPLRTQFNAEPAVKTATEVAASWQKVRAAAENPTAAGDLSLLTGYMKLIDPGSTVRETEFANASNAGGVPQRIRALFNNVQRGERLTPEQRADFVAQADKLARVHRQQVQSVIGRYRGIAERAGVLPEDVLFDPFDFADVGQPPVQQPGAGIFDPVRAKRVMDLFPQIGDDDPLLYAPNNPHALPRR